MPLFELILDKQSENYNSMEDYFITTNLQMAL